MTPGTRHDEIVTVGRPSGAITRLLGAELAVVLSPRTTRIVCAAGVVLAVGALLAHLSATAGLEPAARVRIAVNASSIATLLFAGVAGVLSATTDYRHHLIEQRLLTEPNRHRVALAKAMVVAGIGAVFGVIGAVATWLMLNVYALHRRHHLLPTTDPALARTFAGTIIGGALFAVLGLGLGLLVRRQPASLGGWLTWVLVAEPLIHLAAPTVGRWLPSAAGKALTYSPEPYVLSQAAGGLVLAAYAALSLCLGWRRLTGSDV